MFPLRIMTDTVWLFFLEHWTEFVLCFIIILLLSSFQKPPQELTHSAVKDSLKWKFLAFANLVDISYERKSMDKYTANGWKFEKRCAIGEGRFLVWRVMAVPPPSVDSPASIPGVKVGTFVVVCRGSHVVQDWLYHDVQLALNPDMFVANTEEEFDNFTATMEKQLDLLHTEKPAHVFFCGHSLGASVAQLFHTFVHCGNNSYWSTVSPEGVLAFDTPSLSASHALEEKNVTVVNSPVNIVNMLNRPRCTHLYACGSGSRVYFPKISAVCKVFYSCSVGALAQMILANADEHRMSSIRAYLTECDFESAEPNDWFRLSGLAVGMLQTFPHPSHVAELFARFRRKSSCPVDTKECEFKQVDRNMNPLEEYEVDIAVRHPDLQRVPIDVNEMEEMAPYYVGVDRTVNGVNDMQVLAGRSNDVFIVCIGKTGAGKSSLIRALLKMPPQDKRIPIGRELDVNKEIIVAVYKGGSKGNAGYTKPPRESVDLQNISGCSNFADLIPRIQGVAGCAIWVVQAAKVLPAEWNNILLFKKETKLPILIAMNHIYASEDDSMACLRIVRRVALEKNIVSKGEDVVLFNANANHPEHHKLDSLKSSLSSFIGNNWQKIQSANHDAFLKSEEGKELVEAEILRIWNDENASAWNVGEVVGTAIGFAVLGAVTLAVPAAGAVWYGFGYYGVSAGVLGGGSVCGIVAGVGGKRMEVEKLAKINVKKELKKEQKKLKKKLRKKFGSGRLILVDTPGVEGGPMDQPAYQDSDDDVVE